ncbi:MAG TPA: TrbI/VirB10 family protein [Alphaproteobacteria bacterium]|nr:TrbI/VirB10 family protein [Alphaproteobacteria bacterium]
MTNNLEEFDQPEPGEEQHEPPRGMMGNLAEAWRTRPLFKLIVLMTVIGGIIAASLGLFSGPTQTANNAHLPRPPDIHEAPGGAASPYFNQQTKEANAQRAQQAIQSGGSAIPTPIGNANNSEMGGGGAQNDQLNELRLETERLKQQLTQVQQKEAQPQQPPQQPKPFDDTLAQAMQREMEKLTDSWKPEGVKDVTVSKEKEAKEGKAGEAGAAGAAGAASAPPVASGTAKVVVPAGTVSYAQLLTEANSDVPGPILAQILSGPFAGGRATGTFKTINDYDVLTFGLVNYKGKDYSVNAIALDPDTTLGGMATEVDPRYFTRVVLPAAAGFLQGLGSALSQGSSSVVTNGTTTIVQQSGKGIDQGMFLGLSQAAQTMGQFFQNQANQTHTLVKVAAGTPIGFFFITSATDQNPQQAPYGVPYGGYPPGYYPGGYGANGYGANGYGAPVPQGGYPAYPGVAGYPGYNGYAGAYGQEPANVSYPGAMTPQQPVSAAPVVGTPTTIGTTSFGH